MGLGYGTRLTDILLLELAGQVTLDEGGLACTAVTDQHELTERQQRTTSNEQEEEVSVSGTCDMHCREAKRPSPAAQDGELARDPLRPSDQCGDARATFFLVVWTRCLGRSGAFRRPSCTGERGPAALPLYTPSRGIYAASLAVGGRPDGGVQHLECHRG